MGFVRQPWDPYFHAKSKSFQPQRLRAHHENMLVQKYLALGFYKVLFQSRMAIRTKLPSKKSIESAVVLAACRLPE